MTNASFAFQKVQYLLRHCGLPLHCSELSTGPPQQSKWAVEGCFTGLENVHKDAIDVTDQEEKFLRPRNEWGHAL